MRLLKNNGKVYSFCELTKEAKEKALSLKLKYTIYDYEFSKNGDVFPYSHNSDFVGNFPELYK
jgi:Asp-tRNA(Asn)/Glu-tRNA(Gln) amidotransferase B subunit